MKKSTLLLTLAGLPLASLKAQTVPLFLNYQGKLTGSNNIPLGSAGTAPNFTAKPENRKIIFRIYDAQTGGNRLWSEMQTVTVALGEFSVLLGQGGEAIYDSKAESRPALDTVFTNGGNVTPSGPLRYLEIVVDNGNNTFTSAEDPPISPRQRLTATAYCILAAKASTVAAGSITNAALSDGAVTSNKIADKTLTAAQLNDLAITAAKIADKAVTTLKLADQAVTAAQIKDKSITAAQIADQTLTATQIKDQAIGETQIRDESISTAKLKSDAVTTERIKDSAITSAKIKDGSVTAIKIPDSIITGAKILDGTINTSDLADGSITEAKLNLPNVGLWSTGGFSVYRYTGNVGIGTFPAGRGASDKLHLMGIDGNGSNALRLEDSSDRYIRMWRSEDGMIIEGNSLSRVANRGSNRIQWDGDGNWDSLSDRALKKDITDAEPLLDRLMKLPVRSFHWKGEAESDVKTFGVIAQEVKPLFPLSVGKMSNGEGQEPSMTVKYATFGLIAVKGVQELKEEMDARFTALKQENEELKKRLAALEDGEKARDAKLAAAIEALTRASGNAAARPGAGAE